MGVDHKLLKKAFVIRTEDIIKKATLQIPSDQWMQYGGRNGNHTEYFGLILADLQWMQRAYPGLEW